ELGLGTCIVGWFNEKKVRSLLHIPASSRPVLIITIGYPKNDEFPEKKRKPFEKIYNFNDYKGKMND
ncbi:MAG: nitroreductase family protein, partial [Bacteroidota bacterium]|nr:nitroreductase family protein [Bacteroidota bacterium]